MPLFIAFRYLFAKKSHNVINIISAISAAGLAIGTAALILILSVYNGFDGIIKDNLSDLDPDILVSAASGKHFSTAGTEWDELAQDPRVASMLYVIEDNVFLSYGSRQAIARARGVEDAYAVESGLAGHIVDGEFRLHNGEVPLACVGSTIAWDLGIRANFTEALEIWYPDRDAKISPSNPAASLRSGKAWPKSIFSISSDSDAGMVIIPLETMRMLTGLGDEVTGVEIRLNDPSDRSIREFISSAGLGPDYVMSDRYRQHPSLFRMMRYEKLAIFMILIFVVIIIAFNIFGSLSMLVIEKQDDVRTLQALGATGRTTDRIFVLEGWLISLLGLAVGLVAGIGLALLQQRFGIVKMPGNFLIQAYPVVLKWTDVLWTALGVATVGLVTALAGRKAS